jgi:hypothetical protein
MIYDLCIAIDCYIVMRSLSYTSHPEHLDQHRRHCKKTLRLLDEASYQHHFSLGSGTSTKWPPLLRSAGWTSKRKHFFQVTSQSAFKRLDPDLIMTMTLSSPGSGSGNTGTRSSTRFAITMHDSTSYPWSLRSSLVISSTIYPVSPTLLLKCIYYGFWIVG